jgi:TRAP-type C4-dicarboxylate transport system permease small subunit
MWASNSAGILKKYLKPVCYWSTITGGIALVLMMLLISIDVSLRVFLNAPIRGIIEMVECLLIIVIFSGMPYVEILDEHIKVDVLVGKLPPVAQKTITASANLLTAGIIAIIGWQCLHQGQFLITSGYHSGILRIPQWPFALISGFFIMLFALAAFINFLESLAVLVGDRPRNYLWVMLGIFIVAGLLAVSMKPDIITMAMEESTFGIISLFVLFGLIFSRVHVGAAMALTALWGMAYLTDTESGLSLLGMVSQTVASNYVWSVAPLFMLMGVLVAASEFSRDLYNAAYKWLGHMRGGLASATLAACAAFAAVVGDSLSGVITMGTIALPEMKKFKYDIKLATGCIAVGGSLGILIPPSICF